MVTDPNDPLRQALQAAAPDPASDQQASEDAPKTYTQEELDAQLKRAAASQSKEAKRAATAEAQVKQLAEDLAAYKSDLERSQKERDEIELASLDGDDDQKKLLLRRQADRQKEATLLQKERDLEKRQKEIDGLLAEAESVKKTAAVEALAKKHKLDAKALTEKAEKLGVMTPEGLEDLASIMEMPKREPNANLSPDNLVHTGATGKPLGNDSSQEDLAAGLKKAGVI